MKKEFVLLLMSVFLISCTFPLLSAEIIIESNFDDVYNIDDKLNVVFSVERQSYTEGFVDVYLECGNSDFLFERDYMEREGGEEKKFGYSLPASIKGDCVLRVELLDSDEESIEKEKSDEFEITDRININYDLNKKDFSPGDEIKINGTAIKENGEKLEGFIRVSSEKGLNDSRSVENGSFSFKGNLEEEAMPGKQNLVLYAYEKNIDEKIINKGKEKVNISIESVPSSIEIIANKSEIKPPANISAKIELYDQGNNTMKNKSVSVKIFGIENITFDGAHKTGSFFNYSLKSNAPGGRWKIMAYYENKSLSARYPFYVLNNSQIEEEWLGGGNLTLMNIGNVEYAGDYIVNYSVYEKENSSNKSFSEINLLENTSLKIGEERTFDLRDELNEGTYNITTEKDTYENVTITSPASAESMTGYAVAADINPESYIPALIILGVVITGFFAYKRRVPITIYLKNKFNFSKKEKKEENDSLVSGVKKEKKSKTKEKESKTGIPVSNEEDTQKYIHMAFFDIGVAENEIDIDKITKRHGFSIKKMKQGVYFVLSYSRGKNVKTVNEKIVELAREVRLKAKNKGKKVSIVINSGKFFNKASFLKDFSLETRSMLDYIEKGILVSENVYKRIGMVSRQSSTVRVRGELVSVYKIN